MKSRLFQYAIIFHPSEKEVEAGVRSEIVVDPTTVLAADERSAIILASRQLPEQFVDRIDQLEIAIRPF